MDAANPLRRWLRAAALPLSLAAGCKTTPDDLRYNEDRLRAAEQAQKSLGTPNPAATPPAPVARPQAPAEPVAPGLPPPPPGTMYPTPPPVAPEVVPATPAGPVTGQPVAAGFTPGGAGLLKPAVPQGTPSIKMVAIVGSGNIVTDQEVWESVRQRQNEYLKPTEQGVVRDDAREKEIYKEELRRVIERELILDDMYFRLKKNNKGAVIEEIKDFSTKAAEKQLRDFCKGYGVRNEQELQDRVFTPQGLTVPVIRRQLERQMMADEYVRGMMKEKGKAVGLAEIRDYYEKHPDEFRTEDRVKWLEVFVSLNRFPTPKAAHDHAVAVQQYAAAGGDFIALAKAQEPPGSRRENFDGIGTARGKIVPPEVEPTVWALEPGQVSGLVETPTGYHVVKVTEREVAGVRPLDEKLQDQIRRKLLAQLTAREYRKMVEELWRKGVVKVIEMPQ